MVKSCLYKGMKDTPSCCKYTKCVFYCLPCPRKTMIKDFLFFRKLPRIGTKKIILSMAIFHYLPNKKRSGSNLQTWIGGGEGIYILFCSKNWSNLVLYKTPNCCCRIVQYQINGSSTLQHVQQAQRGWSSLYNYSSLFQF